MLSIAMQSNHSSPSPGNDQDKKKRYEGNYS